VERYHRVAAQCDAVVVVGTDYTDVSAPTEFSYNARIAANLGAPVLLVLNGSGRSPAELRTMTTMAVGELKTQHGTLFAVIANRVDESRVLDDAEAIGVDGVPAYAIPEEPLLSAPSVGDLMVACDGVLLSGDESLLGREATGL
jgi:phosphate acetyltransferase